MTASAGPPLTADWGSALRSLFQKLVAYDTLNLRASRLSYVTSFEPGGTSADDVALDIHSLSTARKR
jgi:hypothetical protein